MIRQLSELMRIADLKVYAIRSAMFGDRPANPALLDELNRLGLKLQWEPDRIAADVIVLQNP